MRRPRIKNRREGGAGVGEPAGLALFCPSPTLRQNLGMEVGVLVSVAVGEGK